jgi:hypothetical protein
MACGRRAGYEDRPQVTIPDPRADEAILAAKRAANRD